MYNHSFDTETRTGTIGGTLLVILFGINPSQLLDSVVLAATGAFVSFAVSVACRFFWKKINK